MGPMEIIILAGLAWYLTGVMKRRAQRPAAPARPTRHLEFLKIGAVIGLVVFGAVVAAKMIYVARGSSTPATVTVVGTEFSKPYGLPGEMLHPIDTQFVVPDNPIGRTTSIGISMTWIFVVVIFLVILSVLFSTVRWITFRPSARADLPQSMPRRHSRLGSVAAKGILVLGLVLLSAGLFITVPVQRETSLASESIPRTIQNVAEYSYSGSGNPSVPFPAWMIVAGIALITVLIWQRKSLFMTVTPRAPSQPVDEDGLAWGWLVIPTLCFATLLTEAIPLFNSSSQPESSGQLPDFSQQHERMVKSIKDFVETQAKQSDDISSINEWLVEVARNGTDADHIALASGPYSTAQEAEAELLPVVANLIQREFHKQHAWQGRWPIPLTLIRERAIENQFIERQPKTIGKFSGDLFKLYMLVNLSPDVLRTFETGWKAAIIERRLIGIGLIVGWIVSQLLLCLAYFQSQGNSPQPGRWWWKLGATCCCVALTVGASFVLNWIVYRM
ncbi:MAG: hypothetical protein JWM11_2395 [Planctomycetaceae bacterium]|nr:hypothetical protein [Planctomycetaceae bacterium]